MKVFAYAIRITLEWLYIRSFDRLLFSVLHYPYGVTQRGVRQRWGISRKVGTIALSRKRLAMVSGFG